MIGRVLSNFIRYKNEINKKINNIILSDIVGRLEKPFTIDPSVEFRNAHKINIQKGCIIKRGSIIDGRTTRDIGISFGPETYIKEYCYIDSYDGYISIDGCIAIGQFSVLAGQGGIEIGKYVMLGAKCYILTSNHITDTLELPYILQGDRKAKVQIEDNVWIGGGAIILAGTTIGRNSIIGAGSIVTTNIPPNSIFVDRNPKLLKSVLHKYINALS